ncbi:MAG: type II toxin-antitoxin system VapB family antitoxin [Betaproteobacteria bacterium]
MRTNIVIDEQLMRAAMKSAGTRTKRETVELALKMLAGAPARRKAYARILAAAGSGGFTPGYDVHKERRRSRLRG